MKYLLACWLLTLLFFSCASNKSDEKPIAMDADTPNKMAITDLDGCYRMNIGQDTAYLKLEENAGVVKGNLVYKRFEKDSNVGTFEGTIKDGYLNGWYKFQSEGVISVKEIYFKINGDKLVEGYGDMDMKNDTAFFKFPGTLNYEEQHPYLRANCNTDF